MSMRLSRDAYEKLVKEDIEWLEKQPRSLERDHIQAILEKAVEYEYGPREIVVINPPGTLCPGCGEWLPTCICGSKRG